MSDRAVAFGVVGLGQIYQLAHTRAFVESGEARIAAVCDINEEAVERESAELGAAGYSDYRELLADPAVEAVDIVLPHNLHHAAARDALEAGKHVLVEKPMTTGSGQSLELIEIASANGLKFTVNENTRFIAAYREVRRVLEAGTIGEPTLVRTLICGDDVARLTDTSLWKGRLDGSAGGVIIDAGAHSFYLLKWLFGRVDWLQAVQARVVDESQVEDWAVVSGRLESGCLFSSEFTFTSGGPWNERLEIHGSDGLVVVDQLSDPPAVLHRGKRDYGGSPIPGVPHHPRTWKYRSIAEGVLDFAGSVRDDRPPAVDPMDGHYAVQLIERAYESVAAGAPIQAA